jgi:hypothetical protein
MNRARGLSPASRWPRAKASGTGKVGCAFTLSVAYPLP